MVENVLQTDRQFSNDDIIGFFDNQLTELRLQLKKAATREELEITLRFCDATSYLKCMWIAEKNK